MSNKALVMIAISVLSAWSRADIYHFNGVITSVAGPDVPYNVGDQFNVSIEIDLLSQGYLIDSAGTPHPLANTAEVTHYAAHYISGDAVENVEWDGWTEHYYAEPTGSGTSYIGVLNNFAVFAPGVPSIESWGSAPDIFFAQDWRNGSFAANNISGQITSFSVVGDIDGDADGVPDGQDNCTQQANSSQTDADGDNFGNACDGDFNNDCVVNAIDLGRLKQGFFSTDTILDLNGDGIVNAVDLGVFKTLFFGAPGPSGLPNACTP